MKIIKVFANQIVWNAECCIGCIGFFDGVHKGHQKLLQETKKLALQKKCSSACITFDQDPWVVLRHDNSIKNLTPPNVRLEKLDALGIDICYVLHFNNDMASLKKENFIALLKNLKIQTLLCGNDFRFAYKNEGDVNYLQKKINTIVMEMLEFEDHKVASSTIEKSIKNGDIRFANACLGNMYEIRGHVIHGNQVGRTLDFPTANIQVDENYVWPAKGVYAGCIKVHHKIHIAIINVGYNPTLNTRVNISLEAYILDFNEDIYGEYIHLMFYQKLREEIKFSSKIKLITQMYKDEERVRELQDEIKIVSQN
ncbi:MAG: bifunctional riboflavin kinase/FAD synthetase [Breznakia sp.]